MIFKDEVSIEIKAGKGGDGAKTFRREKYVPHGGPDGGDGGDGGSVFIKVNHHLRTLSHIHNNQKFKAEDGQGGMGSKMHGRKGQSINVEVPAGTIVTDAGTGAVLADLTEKGAAYCAGEGGHGGRGNVHFKSSTNQTPFYAEKGWPGEKKSLKLELKMIAHVGLVGYPNAGKSTLCSRITSARPKIGNYPFTTLKPNIGVMTVDDEYTSLLIADIPGLIEGAHEGKGLGIDFLKHIERTRLILYVLDAADDPAGKLKILQGELKSYSSVLYKRDFLIALNKMDMVTEEADLKALDKKFKKHGKSVLRISALTGQGLKELKAAVYSAYREIEKREREEGVDED